MGGRPTDYKCYRCKKLVHGIRGLRDHMRIMHGMHHVEFQSVTIFEPAVNYYRTIDGIKHVGNAGDE